MLRTTKLATLLRVEASPAFEGTLNPESGGVWVDWGGRIAERSARPGEVSAPIPPEEGAHFPRALVLETP